MNCLMFLKKLKKFLGIKDKHPHPPKPQPKISILIPFSTGNRERKRTFNWLMEYWHHELPDAEFIIGHSKSKVFCKGEALNDAFSRSTGKVILILDADAYMDGATIEYCADRILEELDNHLWYVPYRWLYRLDREITHDLVESDPLHPMTIPCCPPPSDIIDNHGHTSKYGHRYGAMAMIFPRQAIELLGCFDERFKGWGGEDVALLRALDTLWGKHKTIDGPIFHLWHPYLGTGYKDRRWAHQKHGSVNSKLANEYHKATRRPSQMRALVDEGCKHKRKKK